jgi:quercetin dioxygenase-like cupin family protein
VPLVRSFALALVLVAAALVAAPGGRAAHAQDPAVVNAATVHVRLENDRVRVLESELPPGAREQLHSHPACVLHVLAGGKGRNHLADGTVTETELKTGDTLYREPTTHWAENVGTTTIHVLIVELKPGK